MNPKVKSMNSAEWLLGLPVLVPYSRKPVILFNTPLRGAKNKKSGECFEIRILGACPRIGILFKIEKFSKNKHSHMFDIASIIF